MTTKVSSPKRSYVRFRADRVRTLRRFFQQVAKLGKEEMVNLNHIFIGVDIGNPTCGSVGCVEGWTLALFGGSPSAVVACEVSATANSLLGTKGNYGPMINAKAQNECLFSTQRHPNLLQTSEALTRLTKLLRMRGVPLRGKLAQPVRQVEGFEFMPGLRA